MATCVDFINGLFLLTTWLLASDCLLSLLTCAHFEAAVVEAPSVVVLVSAHEDVGEAGLAHAHGAQDDDAGAGEQILIVRNSPAHLEQGAKFEFVFYSNSENILA